MAFKKQGSHAAPITALNRPENWDMMNTSALDKIASIDKTKTIDLNGFDLQAAVEKHPEHLFVKVFAIKKDEVNDNGDAFSEAELKRAAHTFIGVPVFVNHQNDDVEKARGRVLHAWYDESAGGVYCINMVDRTAYPQLARGIEEGYITGTSMGAQVGYSLCSICHNKAHSADEFCSHIKNSKTRKFNGKVKNAYHDSPSKPTDNDPITGKKPDEEQFLNHKEAQVFEWNYDIKFIEDSFVVNPACHDCLVCDILNVGNVEAKMASQVAELQKVASRYEEGIAKNVIEKTAGKMEIQALNDAMNLIEKVTRSILAQKQHVDMEYASDLVEVLSDLQSSTDELIEMGYASLPSPSQEDMAYGTDDPASPVDGGAEQVAPEAIGGEQPSFQPQVSGISSEPAAEVGTVTRPNFSAASSDNGEDFLKISNNVSEKLHKIQAGLRWAQQLMELRRIRVTDPTNIHEASSGDKKITIATNDDGEIYVGEWEGSNLVAWASADKYDQDMRMLMVNNPQDAAKNILASLEKESESAMAKENKTAAGSGVTEEQTEVITQKQLDKSSLELHNRQEEHYETITEGDEQLGGSERVNDTTSASPQVRSGSYEFITQAQLEEITEGCLCRWKSYPEVITEKQWDDMSRSVGAILPEDWTDSITQAQLISLRDSHRWEDPEVITQGQLDDQGEVMPHGDTARWKAASNFDAKMLVEAATNTVADAIANYGLTPADVRKAVTQFSLTPQHQMKAAYLTLLNAVPAKVAERNDQRQRDSYFGKKASVNAVDGLLAAMGDNVGFASATDFIDAVRFVANDDRAITASEKLARTKIASSEASDEVVDKNDQFRQAFAEMGGDGLYSVSGTFEDDLEGADPDNRDSFLRAVLSFSAKQVENDDIILANVKVDKDLGVFEATVKESSVATDEEKTAFANLGLTKAADAESGRPEPGESFAAYVNSQHDNEDDESDDKTASRRQRRQELVRKAQMMGGQMPAGLGDGGAGGASLPMPPGDDMGDPVDSFDTGGDETLDDMGGSGDLEAAPPGSRCPVCGSDDVDIIAGKGQCNNCGAEYAMKIDISVLKWPGTMDGDDEAGDVDEFGGEGLALDDAGMDQDLPVAAFTRINKHSLEKIASQNIGLGSVSPYTGSTDTIALGDGAYICLNTGNRYQIRQAMKGDELYMQWEWVNKVSDDCESCKRAKKTFASALSDFGVSEAEFDAMSLGDRGRTILAMNDKGLLRRVKTASAKNSVLGHFKEAYGIGDKFPTERCRELIARRFGENAVALSGPDEGENLADSICKRLSTASIYSDQLAVKVAEVWAETDGCITCFEDFIRGGFSAKQAGLICDQLQNKYAQAVEFLADELEDTGPSEEVEVVGIEDNDFDSGFDETIDPFADDAGDEFVTVELPLELIEKFDEAMDEALGEDPALEDHHEVDLPEGEAELALPGDAADAIEDVTEDALDTAVDMAEGVTEVLDGDDGDDEGPDNDGPGGFDADGLEDDADKEGMGMGIDMGSMASGGENHDSPRNEKESMEEIAYANDNSEDSVMREASDMADRFKKGRIASSHTVTLDLSAVEAVLNKEAGDSTITQKNVQDDSDIQPTSNPSASQMGHEDKLTLDTPDAPSAGTGATMGKESDDLAKTDMPHVPAGGSPMGGEADQGYTPEKGHDFTGGEEGAGNSKAASTKERQTALADRLIAEAETKLDEAKPVADDEDVQPISNNKDHSHTPEDSKITPHEESDNVEVPEDGSGAFMGHEEESIGDVPKAPDHQPEIPEGGGVNDHYDKNDRYAPEKQERLKGTVIAEGNEESTTARKEAAIRVAGRMLEAKQINAGQLPAKIAELERYEPEQIADLEKAMFGVVRKGLDTVAQGSETAFVVPDSSNVKNASEELTNKLQGLFSLHNKNIAASEDPNADLRRYRY